MFTKYVEEYEMGELWRSRGRTITETDIILFAGLSGDWHPLHTDQEFAKETMFQQRIAHGTLILSVATGLIQMDPNVVVAFYGIDHLRFTAPTFIGDTVHVEMEVTDVLSREDGKGVLTVRQQVKKQSGETVIVGTIRVLLNSRKEGAPL
ncbi:MaoC/PaaZ C-terminal domain-containing protein [Brevibacillus sp. H7]|uniref:MaoC/PaaZ C-terminal domain-containing protein n=1 Tax=Brevibacillus sp. H7 TaxID=3349138 RepID=UPI00381FC21E